MTTVKLRIAARSAALLVLFVALAGSRDTCAPIPVEGVCATDAECAAGEACVDGQCVATCAGEGESILQPETCCEGLSAVSDCALGEPCPISLRWCVACGDGACGEHETADNCPSDCGGRCAGREGRLCPDGEACLFDGTVDPEWGECFPSRHAPLCLYQGTRSEGWYWSDTGERIAWDLCAGEVPVCTFVGTRSEGFWVYGAEGYDEAFIAWDLCAPRP